MPTLTCNTRTLQNSARQSGRTLAISLEGAPSPLSTVEPFQPATCSRPGPVHETDEGVFRTSFPGKYNEVKNASSPKSSEISSPDKRRGELLVYYQNVGGINTSVEEYRRALSDQCYDIVVLVETWLKDDTLSSQVFGQEYEVFRCDRNSNNSRKSIGGGVLVAVRANRKVTIIENSSWSCVEQVWTSIELDDRKLFLCALYVPPDRTRDLSYIDAHCNSVSYILDAANTRDVILVLGDFNLPGISWISSPHGFLFPESTYSGLHAGATNLLDSYSTATLSQINPISNENNRLLDLCFVSDLNSVALAQLAPAPLVKSVAHHPPLILTVDHELVHDSSVSSVAVSYDFHRADHRSISELLVSLDWESILDPVEVETAAQTFSNVLAYVIDRHVPKKDRKRQNGPPWQTSFVRRLKSIKRAALRRFTKYRTTPLKNYYIRINHEYKRASRESYRRYLSNIQRKFKSHPKSFWKYVNEQRREAGLPSTMVLNDHIGTNHQEICMLFSEKFSSVFTDEALSTQQIELAAGYVAPSNQTLGAIEIDEAMITRACAKLKRSFNPGPDGFPSALLKRHIDALVVPLLLIFRASIARGVFPSCWKFAHLFPVHKKGNKQDVNNYRGITSLSATSKLFELVIMEPLQSHCKQFLSEDQHGFTPGRSTVSNLLCLTSYITQCMDSRTQADVIYTDLSAAFDTVNHDIAIAKLDRLGVNGNYLQWFRSYLTERELKVVIGDSQAPSFIATSGIPQGSHLGPLIFLLYFNDVHFLLEAPRLSYADDLKIFLRINSAEDCDLLQRQLHVFADWCGKNRMTVNPQKCSVISFSRKKQPINFNYHLLGSTIERVSHVKDLGVILDTQLTYKQHVSYIIDKASRTLGCIFRIAKNFDDLYCIKSLYCSLVRTILEYCAEVWSPNYNNGVERIESVQRRFLRFVLRRLPWRDPLHLPSYYDRCRLIRMEPLHTRRDAARALYVADIMQGRLNCSAILRQININVTPRALRNSSMLRLPFRRTNYSMHGAITGLQRAFNKVASVFDFNIARQTLRRRFLRIFSNG